MKKAIVCVVLCSAMAYNGLAQTATILTDQERLAAVKILEDTQREVLEAVKGLSDEQLNYKPAPDKWSVGECLKHIAAAEKELWPMAQQGLSAKANPESRSKIKFSDEELVKAVEDRSHKSTTFAALEPVNSPYHSIAESLTAFTANRKALIDFVKTTKADLRGHVLMLPLGNYDVYQFILLIAAHSNRHTQQINEVKANAGFPK